MFFVSFQKWTVIVDTAGHINYSNDKCPWWTVIVEKSTIVVQWTVIVTAATISVHGGQLSLMDSYRCYLIFYHHFRTLLRMRCKFKVSTIDVNEYHSGQKVAIFTVLT